MAKIFISYRREDAQYQADRLHRGIQAMLADPENVFIDIDHIPFGVNYVEHIETSISKCDICLVVIGNHWLGMLDAETGGRRLDSPEDPVRMEIASALRQGKVVVPVLLDGVPVPSPDDLPEDLRELTIRNGMPVGRRTFEADVTRLVEGLGLPDSELSKRGRARIAASTGGTHQNSGKGSGGAALVLTSLAVVALLGAAGGAFWYFQPFAPEGPFESAERDPGTVSEATTRSESEPPALPAEPQARASETERPQASASAEEPTEGAEPETSATPAANDPAPVAPIAVSADAPLRLPSTAICSTADILTDDTTECGAASLIYQYCSIMGQDNRITRDQQLDELIASTMTCGHWDAAIDAARAKSYRLTRDSSLRRIVLARAATCEVLETRRLAFRFADGDLENGEFDNSITKGQVDGEMNRALDNCL